MVPAWTRAWRFASPYAYAVLDILFAILWFAAFISVATWNSAGIHQGVKDKKPSNDSGSCSTFAYGSEAKCEVSKATVGLGVVLCITFILTGWISSYNGWRYFRTGELPGNPHAYENPASIEAQTKDAWSTDVDEIDQDDHAESHRAASRQDDEHHLLESTDTNEGRHPGRQLSYGGESHIEYDGRLTPSAISPVAQENQTHVHMPSGNYSFS
ncbi:hypothetical protein H2203_000218 [Taxawa tesnikishii (nom. ined.)]|nr:hypothetical protein H2203_000218 [Dothideales sp. JES 119]